MAGVMPSPSASPQKQHTLAKPQLEVPDDESQRGRKRRRSSNNSPPPHLTSNASTTLRGRARRRSESFALSDVAERPRSLSRHRSPGRKHAKREIVDEKESKRSDRSLSRGGLRRGDGQERKENVKPRWTRSVSPKKKLWEGETSGYEKGKEKDLRRDSPVEDLEVEIDEVAVED